jgi:hypothetical protein
MRHIHNTVPSAMSSSAVVAATEFCSVARYTLPEQLSNNNDIVSAAFSDLPETDSSKSCAQNNLA